MDNGESQLVIERTVELDVGADELWALIATPEGWTEWLVDHARLVDGAGIVRDGDVTRHVRVGEVRDGRSIDFTWWEDGDPSSVAHVRFAVDGTRLTIVERLLTPVATAEAKVAWEVRVCSLWACTVAAALV